MPTNPLREKLRRQQTTCGLWITLESPSVTEAAAGLGIDWIVVEMEHGHLAWRDVVNHLRVATSLGLAGLVRIADGTRENIQRALDLGASGIIVPMIGGGEELERVFQFGRYPPRGVRGVSGERCVKWGLEFESYLRTANEETLLIPLLETRQAVENIDSILDVPGLEAIYFGPADMSASFGLLGQWDAGPVGEAIQRMQRLASARGIFSGILARDGSDAQLRREQGFRLIALGADVNLLLDALRQRLAHFSKTRH
ncbi:MAG: hypothetical protein J5I93_27200 [Pirellulaceae bacterium]|nr:hypothetical protein [Pirellulaceae bacterium]